MVIDVDEKCALLGIDPESFSSVQDKMLDAVANEWWDDGALAHVPEWPNRFTDDEIVAYIRWNGLDKSYPELFTRNGLKRVVKENDDH